MGTFSENKIRVIKPVDPDIPKYLNFEKLRKVGIDHIAKLSGKLWTDHNTHDPGITLLELLVYALMDLGYKTNLPFKDLIAPKEASLKDDNFLSPLEVLTINPVTITDYRKLLLELKEVRNAWIEPTEQEVSLTINRVTNELNCTNTDIPADIAINGLYKIYIEKEPGPYDNEDIKTAVSSLFSKYRNLCEDLVTIEILNPVDFGVCAEVELEEGQEATKIYIQIIHKIKNFIQPEITYYTLEALLKKGRTIDEIFAGRPYRRESFGFIDTEEFEKLERRKAFHLSDLYHVILDIPGVRKIKSLYIRGGTVINTLSKDWIESNKIGNDEVPVFSLDKTCIDLYSRNGLLHVDKINVHKTLSFKNKFRLPPQSLNTEIPYGTYPSGLHDFLSVQNDLPVAYGVGVDGLPDNAGLLRETQALQLKGYLLFYDQLLANYTAQLSELRRLFSLKPEIERTTLEKQTYFSKLPDTVPGLEELLKFYDKDQENTISSQVAIPVKNEAYLTILLDELNIRPIRKLIIETGCNDQEGDVKEFKFTSHSLRTIYIEQLKDSFLNEKYAVKIYKDSSGYFFVLCPEDPEIIALIGTSRHEKIFQATNEAQKVAFLATIKENYGLRTNRSESLDPDEHTFDLNYHPINYFSIIQSLTESKGIYAKRRQSFLDHLLARFGEKFTDYTVLHYQQKIDEKQLDQNRLNDQSNYLNEFAEISRNRGKAYDYLKPSWNTSNVSGFEKRISLLSGLPNYNRRNLCNFEVFECRKLTLKDRDGKVLFSSNKHFETKDDLVDAGANYLMHLKDHRNYASLGKNLTKFDTRKAQRLFSQNAASENIIEAKFNYKQVLYDHTGELVASSENEHISTFARAKKKRADFFNKIKNRRFIPTSIEDCYVDANAVKTNIQIIRSWKWGVQKPQSSIKIESPGVFDSPDVAWMDLVKKGSIKPYIDWYKTAYKWRFTLSPDLHLDSIRCYSDTNKALTTWRQAKKFGGEHKNYQVEKKDDNYFIHLKNDKGVSIASTQEFELQKYSSTFIDDLVDGFKNSGTKPEYIEEHGKFGFMVPGDGHIPRLTSYSLYADEKAAMKALATVYEIGALRKNYLLSGDEANPAYNFMLRNEEEFLAQAPEPFETASTRNKELTKVINAIKGKESPVLVQEQPKRFLWEVKDGENSIVRASREYSSEQNARKNCDKRLAEVASKKTLKILNENLFEFKIEKIPIAYDFVYGDTTTSGGFNQIFKSSISYKTRDKAAEAYASFVNELPKLKLKRFRSKVQKHEFALFKGKSSKAIAFQFKEGAHKASFDTAKAVTNYMSSMYRKDLQANRNFIVREMTENRDGTFAWSLIKKNTPLATTQLLKSNDWAGILKGKLCGLIPPIDLNQCPPKKNVVCPRLNPKKFHYQVCFEDNRNNSFLLNSYQGYDTAQEAMDAMEKAWIDLIQVARDPQEYIEGRISVKEVYNDPESKACGEENFIAVIPEEQSDAVRRKGIVDIIKYYIALAELFPIFKELDENGQVCYRYKLSIPRESIPLSDEEIKMLNDPSDPHRGILIWKSVTCFKKAAEAIDAYRYFYNLVGLSNNCRIFCTKGQFYLGIVEILAESSCEFKTVEEAWDDAFPELKDTCMNCTPGGVRAFIYAAEDCKNYIPFCRDNQWTFKVVGPSYFVAEHTCYYNSELKRDKEKEKWLDKLEKLNWSSYITKKSFNSKNLKSIMAYLSHVTEDKPEFDTFSKFCDLILTVRRCLQVCPPKIEEHSDDEKLSFAERFKAVFDQCLVDSLKGKISIVDLLKNAKLTLADLIHMSNYFPVYKTEGGYCYRLYWPEKKEAVYKPLKPCGCHEEKETESEVCSEVYPFISGQCFDCCEEALKAFIAFCELITSRKYEVEDIAKTEVGPYSFKIVDTRRELAYHPQHYKSLQEVEDAILITKHCAEDVGMHLLEHVLLRPKTEAECQHRIFSGDDVGQRFKSCLLPICPDYDCEIDWQPDLDKEDPCAEAKNPSIHYIPGSDPYSFWGTLVLPAWAKRFRTRESRMAFEKLVYKEVPALIGLHILWLSPHDMCKFEESYRNWLMWMQDHSSDAMLCDPNGIPPNCSIVDCVRTLESEPPCLRKPGSQGECNCKEDDYKDSDECCLPAPPDGSIFWKACPPQIQNEIPGTHLAMANLESVSTSKDKKSGKKVAKKESNKALLAKVRRRRPQYLANIEATENEALFKTKSFERSVHFLKNIPTVNAYAKLVNFFKQYSLQKDNHKKDFLVLIQNATWHLLDHLVLNNVPVKKKELEDLKKSVTDLKDKGLSLTETRKSWDIEELKPLVNTALVNKIKRILK